MKRRIEPPKNLKPSKKKKETQITTHAEELKNKTGEDFVKNYQQVLDHSPTQATVSSYHSITSSSYLNPNLKRGEKGAYFDKARYGRSQDDTLFSNINEVSPPPLHNLIFNNNLMIGKIKGKKEKIEVPSFKYNLGLNGSFGHQINQKVRPEDIVKQSRPFSNSFSTAAKRQLDDRILDHKNDAIAAIVNDLNHGENLTIVVVDTNQLQAKYPAVMVRINENFDFHKEMKKNGIHNEYEDAYPKFLTHLLLASVNKKLYEQGLEPYFDKRQSFGFLTPTMSDAGPAIRVSLGLVPNKEWQDAVVAGIRDFDKLVQKLVEEKKIKQVDGKIGTPYSNFKGGSHLDNFGHKVFLKEFIEASSKDIPMQEQDMALEDDRKGLTSPAIVSEKEEELRSDENGKQKEIVSSPNFVIPSAIGETAISFDEFLTDEVKKALKDSDYFSSLTRELSNHSQANIPGSKEFNQLIDQVIAVYTDLLPPQIITSTSSEQNPNAKIERLNELIKNYKSSLVNTTAEKEEIDFSSDSENEEEQEDQNLKHFTPSGMSALSVPLVAYYNSMEKNDTKDKVGIFCERYCYFEAPGLNKYLSNKFINYSHDGVSTSTNKLLDNKSDNDIVIADLNPCVNDVAPPRTIEEIIADFSAKDNGKSRPKMLIVDVTSATQAQIDKVLEAFNKSSLPILCFAKSGLKNSQLSLDLAQYGEIKLHLNPNQKEHKESFDNFKKELRDLTAASSTVLSTISRREMRESAARVMSKNDSIPVTSSEESTVSNSGKEKVVDKSIAQKYRVIMQQGRSELTEKADAEKSKETGNKPSMDLS